MRLRTIILTKNLLKFECCYTNKKEIPDVNMNFVAGIRKKLTIVNWNKFLLNLKTNLELFNLYPQNKFLFINLDKNILINQVTQITKIGLLNTYVNGMFTSSIGANRISKPNLFIFPKTMKNADLLNEIRILNTPTSGLANIELPLNILDYSVPQAPENKILLYIYCKLLINFFKKRVLSQRFFKPNNFKNKKFKWIWPNNGRKKRWKKTKINWQNQLKNRTQKGMTPSRVIRKGNFDKKIASNRGLKRYQNYPKPSGKL